MDNDKAPEIITGINLLAYMVANTQVPVEELIRIFETLPSSEQEKVRQAFKDVGGSFGD